LRMRVTTKSAPSLRFVWSFVWMLARKHATQRSRTKSGHLETLQAIPRREPDGALIGSPA
jgi:hypothetical protein